MGYLAFAEDPASGKVKPYRVPHGRNAYQDLQARVGTGVDIKTFWALLVWDYESRSLVCWEITQKSIQNALSSLIDSSAWSNPLAYDITVVRKGAGLDTKYTITPSPPSPMLPEITQSVVDAEPDFHALFDNGAPFGNPPQPSTSPVQEHLVEDVQS